MRYIIYEIAAFIWDIFHKPKTPPPPPWSDGTWT